MLKVPPVVECRKCKHKCVSVPKRTLVLSIDWYCKDCCYYLYYCNVVLDYALLISLIIITILQLIDESWMGRPSMFVGDHI